MEYIERLTKKQQTVFDVMLNMVEQKQNYLLSSEDRGIGKTITLNELAFTLQALGHEVYLLSPHPKEFYATNIISLNPNDYKNDYRGINKNSVVIVDEDRYGKMDDLLDYCTNYNIPVIGFVNFNNEIIGYVNSTKNCNLSMDIETFNKEYLCNWNFQF